MNKEEASNILFTKLEDSLPSIFTREVAAQHLGGVLSAKTLNNIDSLGLGPKVRRRIGKKVAYERDSFIAWLKDYRPYGDGV